MLNDRRLRPIILSLGLVCAACGDDGGEAEGGGGGATHAEALDVLTKRGCAISSCHGTSAQGELNLATADLRALMVDQAACEAPALKLVAPGDPAKSWLYIKLVAETQGTSGDLAAQSSWGEAGDCDDAVGFGKRMPRVAPYNKLSDADLAVIESWIAGGAPGPL
jgi:hypothetical protein